MDDVISFIRGLRMCEFVGCPVGGSAERFLSSSSRS